MCSVFPATCTSGGQSRATAIGEVGNEEKEPRSEKNTG